MGACNCSNSEGKCSLGQQPVVYVVPGSEGASGGATGSTNVLPKVPAAALASPDEEKSSVSTETPQDTDGSISDSQVAQDGRHTSAPQEVHPENSRAILDDGSVYVGQWSAGFFHGEGQLTSPDGAVFEGQFNEGKKHGVAKYTFANGAVYEG